MYNQYSEDPALGRLERQARQADRGLWAASSPMPSWEWRQRSASGGQDQDCSDFDTQAEAQWFYVDQQPGDPHRQDDNGDGAVCESLPGYRLRSGIA